jgi:hypothetical protein
MPFQKIVRHKPSAASTAASRLIEASPSAFSVQTMPAPDNSCREAGLNGQEEAVGGGQSPSGNSYAHAPATEYGHNFSKLSVRQPQAKLTVNTPGDAYEQEADSVANQVMKMDAPETQKVAREEETDEEVAEVPQKEGAEVKRVMREEVPGGMDEEEEKPPAAPDDDKNVQRKCDGCEIEEMHRTESDPLSEGADVSGPVNEGLQSGGRPLDAEARGYMEPRFGHDFSQVRVHTDARASGSTEAVSARAYTVGNDIAFRSGEYNPGSSSGRQLLAMS